MLVGFGQRVLRVLQRRECLGLLVGQRVQATLPAQHAFGICHLRAQRNLAVRPGHDAFRRDKARLRVIGK